MTCRAAKRGRVSMVGAACEPRQTTNTQETRGVSCDSDCAAGTGLVGGGQHLGLQLLEAPSINVQVAAAGLDAEHFDARQFVLVALTECDRHEYLSLLELNQLGVVAAAKFALTTAGDDELGVADAAAVALACDYWHCSPFALQGAASYRISLERRYSLTSLT